VEALIQVDRVTLPNHALVADGNGVWRARVVHGLEDGVTRLVLDLGFNARGSAREETHQLVAEFLSRYSPYVEAYGESELYITEVNPPSLASLKVLEWLNRLGLYHVDQMGSWLSRC
jgi:hypothetical protein